MRQLAAVLLGALLALSIGCRSAGKDVRPPNETPPALRITQSDASKTVDVAVGKTFEVVLRGNPSTGYQWVRLNAARDVEAAGQPEFKADSKQIGAPGTVTLSFKPTQTGRKLLLLGYRRPWEKRVAPAKTFTVILKVK